MSITDAVSLDTAAAEAYVEDCEAHAYYSDKELCRRRNGMKALKSTANDFMTRMKVFAEELALKELEEEKMKEKQRCNENPWREETDMKPFWFAMCPVDIMCDGEERWHHRKGEGNCQELGGWNMKPHEFEVLK
jgi:hypothetical protein